jgi:hypothetical protein
MNLKTKFSLFSLAFVGIVVLYIIFTGQSGFIYIEPTEIGVKINRITGSFEVLESSGNHVFLPIVEQVFILDSSPQKFVMSGEHDLNSNHVKKLTVRAKDGSNFYFGEVEMQYQIMPSKAEFIIRDSGIGDSYKRKWLKPISRMVLRNEFGRYSSEEIANPTKYGSAVLKSKEELNLMLNKHGLRIIDISTPKPHFDPIYEKTIETRINADQEVSKQKVKREKLLAEKKYRVDKIKNDKEIEYRQIEGELKRKLIDVNKQFIMVRKEAETYKIQQIGAGEAKQSELETMAKARTEQFKMDAQALSSQIKAMEEQGDAVVYKILATKYQNMKIHLQPYSTDANPQKVQIENVLSK